MPETFTFTERRLRDLPDPKPGERMRYLDDECPGLILRVTPGARSFAFRNRTAEVTLGRWPALTVEAARAKVRNDVAPDPAAAAKAKRSAREAQTLRDAWEALLAHPWRRDGKAKLRPATMRSYANAWRMLDLPLGGRALAEIGATEVTRLRGLILKAHGAAGCRQALALLVVLLGGRMPRDASGRTVGKPTVEPRRRFLDSAELGALLRGLDAEPELWRVFWLSCLLAPLRRSNLANARWSDLNLDSPARWTVEAGAAKGGKLLAMPIAEPLARILRDWRGKNHRAEWVFPAGLTGAPRAGGGPIIMVGHAWKRAVLLGESIRLCDAMGPAEGITGRERWAKFREDVELARVASWRIARDRKPMIREGTPLVRCVAALRAKAKALGIDPAPLALENVTPHDLRRTAASWAVQAGASLAVVAASLGHADTRVTEAHYGHMSDDPVRRMLADNAGRLLATATPDPSR